jgi:hypothetical protein
LPIIDQIPENPNSSLLVVVVFEVFRLGTKRRQVWSDADREELSEIQRTPERSACYGLGTALAHLLGQMALALQPQNKKTTNGER